jgi:hypothetical protein
MAGLLGLLVTISVAGAQEPGADDDLMPAVDTSAIPVEPAPRREPRTAPQDSRAMDTLELGRTEITGNQELPKVLYIVPWKKSDPGDLMGRPVNTLIDEVLAPLDREEFVRQVDYFNELQGGKDEE